MDRTVILPILAVLLLVAIVAVAYICLIFSSRNTEAEQRKGEDDDTKEV